MAADARRRFARSSSDDDATAADSERPAPAHLAPLGKRLVAARRCWMLDAEARAARVAERTTTPVTNPRSRPPALGRDPPPTDRLAAHPPAACRPAIRLADASPVSPSASAAAACRLAVQAKFTDLWHAPERLRVRYVDQRVETTAECRAHGQRTANSLLVSSRPVAWRSCPACLLLLSLILSLSQTPKAEKAEKKKKPRGRAFKKMLYNRRFVNVVVAAGGKKGGYNSGGALQNQVAAPAPGPSK